MSAATCLRKRSFFSVRSGIFASPMPKTGGTTPRETRPVRFRRQAPPTPKPTSATTPLRPAYREDPPAAPAGAGTALSWIEQAGGIMEIGHDGAGFAFDNEGPRHRSLLAPYALASRLVTNGEYLEFLMAGGYQRPEYWLAGGFRTARERHWEGAPDRGKTGGGGETVKRAGERAGEGECVRA